MAEQVDALVAEVRTQRLEVGDIIVADVDAEGVASLLAPDGEALGQLIRKQR